MTSSAAIVAFLRAEGAGEQRHGGGRSLLAHLEETAAIVERWEQPPWLVHAALIHSVYGTDAYRHQLVPQSRRAEVAEVAGERAELLAHRFSVTPRTPLLSGRSETEDRDALILLHMANLAEQARAPDGSPGRWLVRLRELAELLLESTLVRLPLFLAELATFTEADEAQTARAYGAGIRRGDDPPGAASRLALAAALCPVVGEPCVWQAYLARCRGDVDSARRWAASARRRLLALGTAWDKRLTFAEWLELSGALARAEDVACGDAVISDPRRLFEATTATAARVPRRASGPERFHRYVETFGDAVLGGTYPDLPSQPWYDAREFALVGYLEAHYESIRAEVTALEGFRFHSESERIPRSGAWDVAFFYERGRRHAEICQACPVITRGIESYETVRTMAGLIYVSRLRGRTHIAAHRGPTNLRLRCHLGIEVPDGDCAIRVGEETRRWQEGHCLVFDDSFEHEAWNHTESDRIVLIVDLWHPELSAAEVRRLEGLHAYTGAHARRLSRYWEANAAARRGRPGDYQSPPSPPSPQPPSPSPPSPQPPPPSPPSPQPPSPSPSPPNRPPTRSSPSPSPAPSAEPISSVENRPPPPNPLK